MAKINQAEPVNVRLHGDFCVIAHRDWAWTAYIISNDDKADVFLELEELLRDGFTVSRVLESETLDSAIVRLGIREVAADV